MGLAHHKRYVGTGASGPRFRRETNAHGGVRIWCRVGRLRFFRIVARSEFHACASVVPTGLTDAGVEISRTKFRNLGPFGEPWLDASRGTPVSRRIGGGSMEGNLRPREGWEDRSEWISARPPTKTGTVPACSSRHGAEDSPPGSGELRGRYFPTRRGSTECPVASKCTRARDDMFVL